MLGRRSAVSFNTSWLEDIYEEHVVELTGERVTPLVSNPGRIMLTSSRLYFQPFNNAEPVSVCVCVVGGEGVCAVSQEPVLKVKLSGLQYVMKRRYMLRHVVRCKTIYQTPPLTLQYMQSSIRLPPPPPPPGSRAVLWQWLQYVPGPPLSP